MAEKLNAPDLHLCLHHSVPQQPMANAGEEAETSNPPPAIEEPVGEISSRVAVRTLIDLEEEPTAVTDTDLLT